MKMFDEGQTLPYYLRKHRKSHIIAMSLLTFVIVPILSILIVLWACKSVNLRVVQTTVSMLAWYNGKLFQVYLWGAVNIAMYFYLLKLNLDGQKYSKGGKIIFYGLSILSTTILLVGLSISFNDAAVIRHILHNTLAVVGFVMLVFILIALVLTSFARNLIQGGILTMLVCFFIISGVFSIPQVNSPDSTAFITAASQMYIFAMIHIIMALDFYLSQILPNNRTKPNTQKIAPNKKAAPYNYLRDIDDD